MASPLAGRAFDKHGVRVLLPVGFALVTVFSVVLSLFIGTGNIVLLAVLYVPVICGCALIIGPVQSFALSRLTPEMNPHGVTVMSTGFQIGGCLGSSVFTGIYSAVMVGAQAAGADFAAAGSRGFLVAGCVAGVLGLVGIALALKEARYEREGKAAPAQGWEGAGEGKAEAGAEAPIAAAPDAAASDAPAAPAFDVTAIMKADVYSVTPDATVSEAPRLFVEKGISGAPLVDGEGELQGIVTDGDIMRYIADQHTDFKGAYTLALEIENGRTDQRLRELLELPISRIATERVVSVAADASLGSVAQLLAQKHFKKVPVMKDGKMVGILNRSNLSKYLLRAYLDV